MRTTARLAWTTALLFSFASLDANAAEGVGNFSGPYGFRFLGLDTVVQHNWVVATGEFSANGKGVISGGSITYNDGGAVCIASISNTSSYSVVSDGEGTLTLQLTAMSGTCPIGPTFDFAIALAAPNTSSVATVVDVNSTAVGANGENNSAIMIYGVANRL